MEEKKVERVYFFIADRVSLNRGKVVVNSIPMSILGKMEYVGDGVFSIENNTICVENDGSPQKHGTLVALRRKDGIVEVTEKLVERMIAIGYDAGFIKDE